MNVHIPVFWALNSPAPMLATEVETVMGKELAHWELLEANRCLRNKLAQQEALASGLSATPEQDAPTSTPASHAAAMEQMRACIQGAVAIMAGMSASFGAADDDAPHFSVTLRGHVDLNAEDGVESRTQVFVDRAPVPRRGWKVVT